MKRYLILALYLVVTSIATAQEQSCTLSNPISASEAGVYKVLCMQNGSTMLLHMEPMKPVGVKIFDSSHKLIASKEHGCSELNVNLFKNSVFKGLFEINGEAVLFFQQPFLNKQRLVRVRISGSNGEITDEEIIEQSKGLAKPMQFYVMHKRGDNSYGILYSTDIPQFKKCEVTVKFYDSTHHMKQEVPVNVDRKPYDYMSVLGADILPAGTSITLRFGELKMNGTRSASGLGDNGRPDVYENYIGVYYIPKDSAVVQSKVVDVSTDFYPYYAHSTYNRFVNSVNVLALSYRDVLVRNGLELIPSALTEMLFLKYEENTHELKYNFIKNTMASNYQKQSTGVNQSYQGIPVKYFTSNTGLSTMISESYNRYQTVETNARTNVRETYLGNIGITQFDDDGEEIWGIVLPVSQFYKSYQQFYAPWELGKRQQDQDLFGDLPAQVYSRQFLSLNAYERNHNHYIIYNDVKENFNRSLSRPGDTLYDYLTANAVCYKITRKNEVTKYNLLGEAAQPEYKASFIEGADFDETRGIYATLVQVRRRDYTALRMAWCKLD